MGVYLRGPPNIPALQTSECSANPLEMKASAISFTECRDPSSSFMNSTWMLLYNNQYRTKHILQSDVTITQQKKSQAPSVCRAEATLYSHQPASSF